MDAVEQLAKVLQDHYPTTGMRVAMGVTCACGYWTGNEPIDIPRGHRPLPWGRDQLDIHRARVVLEYLNGRATGTC